MQGLDKNCTFCDGDSLNPYSCISNTETCGELFQHNGDLVISTNVGDDYFVDHKYKITYCPICGRNIHKRRRTTGEERDYRWKHKIFRKTLDKDRLFEYRYIKKVCQVREYFKEEKENR